MLFHTRKTSPVSRAVVLRVVLDAVVLMLALAGPWWLFLGAAVVVRLICGAREVLFGGLVYDMVHASGQVVIPGGDFVFTVVLLIFEGLISYIAPRVRASVRHVRT